MFYPDKIKSIKETDKVLEIGPGSLPHPRSDIFLELNFESAEKEREQRGKAEKIEFSKPVVYYDGGAFPFEDNEFDYIICSHVLEHVDDVDFFLSELKRVAPKGYLEYPRIYYDYLFNYNCHKNFILKRDDIVYWMTKEDVNFNLFYPIQTFFYDVKHKNHFHHFEQKLNTYLFEGYEWDSNIIESKRTNDINDVCLKIDKKSIPVIEIQEFEELYKNHFHEYISIMSRQFKRKPFKFLADVFRGKYGKK